MLFVFIWDFFLFLSVIPLFVGKIEEETAQSLCSGLFKTAETYMIMSSFKDNVKSKKIICTFVALFNFLQYKQSNASPWIIMY